MPKIKRNDVEYYVRGRKKPIAYSTKATSDFLVMISKQHPNMTIAEIRKELADSNKWIPNYEAIAVIDKYLEYESEDYIPVFR